MFQLSLLLSTLFTVIASWNEMGHLIITRIAEKKLLNSSPHKLSKLYDMLESLQEYFPERKNSLMEPSIIPDVMVNEFQQFLLYFHFINKPIVYHNDSMAHVKIPQSFLYNVTYAYELSKKIVTDSFKNKECKDDKFKYIKAGLVDSLMLRYLMHLVDDAHQPLHAAAFYS